MVDENAFGLVLAYFGLEDEEYATDDRAAFVARFVGFERAALDSLAAAELPQDRHVLSLGHAVYTEFHDADDTPRLVSQARQAASELAAAGFPCVAALSYGGRWVSVDGEPPLRLTDEPVRTLFASAPSEPLRRCLAAIHAGLGDDDAPGWGPALYVDMEASEAVGLKLKNTPTLMRAGGARFFRIALPEPASSAVRGGN